MNVLDLSFRAAQPRVEGPRTFTSSRSKNYYSSNKIPIKIIFIYGYTVLQ